MKFYSEKLSPRRLSLQWRLTLLISGLVITACALMYFFISRSAVTGLEGISDYVVLVTQMCIRDRTRSVLPVRIMKKDAVLPFRL